jgi:hypothetical protein
VVRGEFGGATGLRLTESGGVVVGEGVVWGLGEERGVLGGVSRLWVSSLTSSVL